MAIQHYGNRVILAYMTDVSTDPAVMTPLTARVGFLISQLGFYASERFAQRLTPLGLAPRHFGLLTHLSLHDGQAQQRLADAMGIHRNAMVGIIDELEERGLVRRQRHPDDRRAHAVHLTDHAHDLLTEAQRVADEHDNDLIAALDEQQREQLIELLQTLAMHTDLPAGVHPT